MEDKNEFIGFAVGLVTTAVIALIVSLLMIFPILAIFIAILVGIGKA